MHKSYVLFSFVLLNRFSMKGISLLELARMAGVSKTTASLVLNNKADRHKISKATQKRVLDIARKNNYKPNLLARNLSTGKSMTIGLIVYETSDCVISRMIRLMEQELGKFRYRLLLGYSNGDVEKEKELIDDMIERHVDGIFIMPVEKSDWSETGISGAGVPVVCMERPYPGDDFPHVIFNADAGIKHLISYWYARSKRTIGYVGLKNGNRECRNSYTENYTERFSMKGNYKALLKDGNDMKKMESSLTSLAGKGVNAILFESPALAYNALKIARSSSGTAFKDISFGCYGYHTAFDVSEKTVVYVKLPYDSLAERAAGIMSGLIGKNTSTDISISIEPEFLF